MISNEKKQTILNNAPEGATHYEFLGGECVFFKDVKDKIAHKFFNKECGLWYNCMPPVFNIHVHKIKPSKPVDNNPVIPSAPVNVKTSIAKVMLFDEPYEFTACYHKETFELIAAFENNTNQSVMWSEGIKKLIINEIKGQPKANHKIKYKESVGELSIEMEFTTIDDLLYYLRETKEAPEIEEPEVEDPELVGLHGILESFGELFKGITSKDQKKEDEFYLHNDHLTRVAKGVDFDIQRVYDEYGEFWIVEYQNGLIDFKYGTPFCWEDFKCVFYYEEVLKEQKNLNIAPFKPKPPKESASRVYLNNVISIDKDESDDTINIDRAGQLGVLTFNKDEVTIESPRGL